MKAIAFSLLVFSTTVALGQTVPPAAQPKSLREQLAAQHKDWAAQVPQEAPPMRIMQAPPGSMGLATNAEMVVLLQKQTAAISELSNRIKVLDARLAKLEEKSK